MDSDLRLAGAAWQTHFTADFSASSSARFPGFAGTTVPDGIRLTQPAPNSGFIRLPERSALGSTPLRWTVTAVGQQPRTPTLIEEGETEWRNDSGASGYPNGFPPGTYVVELFDVGGKFLRAGYVVVRSDIASQITFAPERLAGDVNFDGIVDIFDINLLSTAWGQAGPRGDANLDRKVNIFDINALSSSWSVPGPASDINHDGRGDVFDLNLLVANMGLTTPNADLNHDGIVDAADYNALSALLAAGAQTTPRVAANIAERAPELDLVKQRAAVDALMRLPTGGDTAGDSDAAAGELSPSVAAWRVGLGPSRPRRPTIR